MNWADVIEAMEAAHQYFGERADADQPHGAARPIPNEEMRLQMDLEEALAFVRREVMGNAVRDAEASK